MVIEYILLNQILIMFLLMTVGFILFKSKKISIVTNKELGVFLIYIILPASIIKSYITDLTKEKVIALVLSFIAAALALTLSILVSHILFGSRQKIENFGTAFSNAGFIGIPLVKATVGDHAIFYIAAFVALLNILQWTYGVIVMSGSKESVSVKRLITNPVIIALIIGLFFFFTQVRVPVILTDTLSLVGNMTAPIAMITLGVYLAQIKWKELFVEKWVYVSAFFRLIIIPVITFILLSLFPDEYLEIKLTVLIAASSPVGSNVAIFAQLNGLDYTRAVKNVCLTTLLSVITIPIIVKIASIFWI